ARFDDGTYSGGFYEPEAVFLKWEHGGESRGVIGLDKPRAPPLLSPEGIYRVRGEATWAGGTTAVTGRIIVLQPGYTHRVRKGEYLLLDIELDFGDAGGLTVLGSAELIHGVVRLDETATVLDEQVSGLGGFKGNDIDMLIIRTPRKPWQTGARISVRGTKAYF